MPYHHWGGSFDFDELDRAMTYIVDLCKGIGLRPMMKEKYGTVRYEFIYAWDEDEDCPTPEKISRFYKVVDAATRKFPTVAAEIVDELPFLFIPQTEYDKAIFKRWEKILDEYEQNDDELWPPC